MKKQGKRPRSSSRTDRRPDVILCADLHLRDKRPIARVDDYRLSMIEKLSFIQDLAQAYNVPVLGAGDIFDRWKVSPDLLTIAEKYLPAYFITIPGQHDLPTHSFGRFSESALYHLYATGRVKIPLPEYGGRRVLSKPPTGTMLKIYGFEFGEEVFTPDDLDEGPNIALVHQFAYRGRKPWPGCEAEGLTSIMSKLSGFDLIVIGDNHKPFTYKRGSQLVVNCGSMMRMSADQIDYRPRVWLWYAEENEAEAVYLPIREDAISREHIEKIEIRNERIEKFVQQLDGDFDVGMSFRTNLDNFFRANNLRPIVKGKILNALEE